MFILFSLGFGVYGEEFSAYEVISGRDDRSDFFGLEYVYEVDYDVVAPHGIVSSLGDGVLSGRRVLRIGFFDSESWAIPVRLDHYVSGHSEPYLDDEEILVYSCGFDGRTTQIFNRSLFGKQGGPIEHSSYVSAGANSGLTLEDPFFSCLFHYSRDAARFGGTPTPARQADLSLKAFPETSDLFGRVFRIANPDHPERGEVVLSDRPEFHVLRHVFAGTSKSAIRVDSLKLLNGLKHVQSGHYDADFWKASFELSSVNPLASNFSEWHIPWPTGSIVMDHIDNSVTRIPYTTEESVKIRQFFEARPANELAMETRARSLVLFLNLSLVIGIGLLLAFRARFRKTNP